MSNQSDERLGTAPLGKLIFTMALPSVVAQMVNALYNIIDRIYIGRMDSVDNLPLTGVGVCFSIIILITAFSAFVGLGGAPLAAIELGKGNRDGAEKILGNGFSLLLFFSIILTTLFSIFKEPILVAFGAPENSMVYSLEYLDVYLMGTIFVQITVGLNTFITCQGQARTAMCSILIGAIINIILDPIFIFGLNMGVSGAALATVISQACSATWVLLFLISKKSSIRIKKVYMKPHLKTLGMMTALGISPFVMQSTEALISVVFNRGLRFYGGDLYVGSMTILQSVMQLFVMPIQGITTGTQPIISYNYGAGNFDRVKKTFKYSLTLTFSLTLLGYLSVLTWPTLFASLFTDQKEMLDLTTKVLPIFMGGMWMFGVQMACQSAFMGMGQAKISLFLALLRKVFLLVPLAIILPKFFGVMGIYYAEPIADILAAATTATIFFLSFKKLIAKAESV